MLRQHAGEFFTQVIIRQSHSSNLRSRFAGVFIHNRYRHPKAEVFERYGALGVRRLRSDEAGAVTLAFGAELDVAEYRQRHARYWYAR